MGKKKNKKSDFSGCGLCIKYADDEQNGTHRGYGSGTGLDLSRLNGDGTYSTGNDAGSTYYTVNEDTQTISVQTVMVDDTVVDSAKKQVDAIIPDQYKNSDGYAIDIAGEDGNLDCYLTLISEDFATADCQKIAEDIASKIKELNLGIGYLCISFQTDKYNIKALSSIDNLNDQEASEMSTKEF